MSVKIDFDGLKWKSYILWHVFCLINGANEGEVWERINLNYYSFVTLHMESVGVTPAAVISLLFNHNNSQMRNLQEWVCMCQYVSNNTKTRHTEMQKDTKKHMPEIHKISGKIKDREQTVKNHI